MIYLGSIEIAGAGYKLSGDVLITGWFLIFPPASGAPQTELSVVIILFLTVNDYCDSVVNSFSL